MNKFKDSQYLILGTIGILIISSELFVYLYSPVSAHNFSINESAAFLAMTDELKAEVQLVQQNSANNNMSMASEHADKAIALLSENATKEIAERNQRLADDLQMVLISIKASTESAPSNDISSDIGFLVSDAGAIIDEIVTARIDPDQLNNSTIQALAIVELLDKVLSNYGDAYAVGFDMTNMSNLMMGDRSSMSSTGMVSDNISMSNMSSSVGSKLLNVSAYQDAQALAMKVQERFDSQLMDTSVAQNSGTAGQSGKNIVTALQELITSINSRAPPMDIMTIVHTKIHPNLITAFDLIMGDMNSMSSMGIANDNISMNSIT
jgi:hypothetical protein